MVWTNLKLDKTYESLHIKTDCDKQGSSSLAIPIILIHIFSIFNQLQ